MQDVAGSFTEQRVTANGLDLHYLERGDPGSPPLVLLHGLTGHARIWDHMAPALAKRYHLFVPDQRGHGDSAHASSYRTEDYVADLAALVAHWQLERFVLVGLSMGGHSALAYAAAYPNQIAQLCVIDIPPKLIWRETASYAEGTQLVRDGHRAYPSLDQAFADARKDNTTAPDDNLRYRTQHNLRTLPDGTMRLKHDPHAQRDWEPADLWARLPAIIARTLIVRAGLNAYLTPTTAERMAGAIAGDATVVEVPTSGHSVPTDKPELLAPILLDWLAKAPS
jgi:pimeloyl-ACP methyl ester carboxylesterase